MNIEYKKMLEREGESRNILCAKLLEKENEIEECMEVIERLKKKIIGIDQMRKIQTNQIAQLKDSLPDSSQRHSCDEVDSPTLRKFSRDLDLLAKEKDQIESSLKLKSEDLEILEKKYLTVLRKEETLMKQNQQQEVKLLESNQEILTLKSRMKTLKNMS